VAIFPLFPKVLFLPPHYACTDFLFLVISPRCYVIAPPLSWALNGAVSVMHSDFFFPGEAVWLLAFPEQTVMLFSLEECGVPAREP